MNPRTRLIPRSLAFTLVELLVVIAIFVLLLAIAVPAFSSMLYSSEQSLADNHLRMALASARDAAVRSAQGVDAAAVFFFDPVTGHTTILPCLSAGTVQDGNPDPAAPRGSTVEREVFVPAPGYEPVQLPKGWSARGYALPRMIDDQWYEKTYPAGSARQQGNWVFPETGFYDEDDPNNKDGADRQTFMVRFEGGTGVVKEWDVSPVLVLAVNPSMAARQVSPWSYTDASGARPFRVDLEADPERFVRRVSAWPVGAAPMNTSPVAVQLKQQLLGDVSGDTVLAKPVGQLALCNEKKLAAAIGVRLDPVTNCLYKDVSATANPAVPPAQREPTFVALNSPMTSGPIYTAINNWVEGHLLNPSPPPPPASPLIDSDCRIYSIQRYLGTLQEISGTVGGQGVTQ